jgi:hypothetical protein
VEWNCHIDRIISKSNRTLYVTRKVLHKAPTNVKTVAYFALIRPILEYACAVWDPSGLGLVSSLEMVQRKAARFCTNRYGATDSVTEMLGTLRWDSLELRRKANRLSLFSRVYNKDSSLEDLSARMSPPDYTSSRIDHQHKVALIRCSKNVGQQSFLPRSIKEWNGLPQEFFDVCDLQNQQQVRSSLLKLFKCQVADK